MVRITNKVFDSKDFRLKRKIKFRFIRDNLNHYKYRMIGHHSRLFGKGAKNGRMDIKNEKFMVLLESLSDTFILLFQRLFYHNGDCSPSYQAQMSQQIQGQPNNAMMNLNSSNTVNGNRTYSSKSWHTPDNETSIRPAMINEIIRLLKTRRLNASDDWHEKLPNMAKRLEDALYHEANSLSEYSDNTTLKSRLQQLAVSMGGNKGQNNRNNNINMNNQQMRQYSQQPQQFNQYNAGNNNQQLSPALNSQNFQAQQYQQVRTAQAAASSYTRETKLSESRTYFEYNIGGAVNRFDQIIEGTTSYRTWNHGETDNKWKDELGLYELATVSDTINKIYKSQNFNKSTLTNIINHMKSFSLSKEDFLDKQSMDSKVARALITLGKRELVNLWAIQPMYGYIYSEYLNSRDINLNCNQLFGLIQKLPKVGELSCINKMNQTSNKRYISFPKVLSNGSIVKSPEFYHDEMFDLYFIMDYFDVHRIMYNDCIDSLNQIIYMMIMKLIRFILKIKDNVCTSLLSSSLSMIKIVPEVSSNWFIDNEKEDLIPLKRQGGLILACPGTGKTYMTLKKSNPYILDLDDLIFDDRFIIYRKRLWDVSYLFREKISILVSYLIDNGYIILTPALEKGFLEGVVMSGSCIVVCDKKDLTMTRLAARFRNNMKNIVDTDKSVIEESDIQNKSKEMYSRWESFGRQFPTFPDFDECIDFIWGSDNDKDMYLKDEDIKPRFPTFCYRYAAQDIDNYKDQMEYVTNVACKISFGKTPGESSLFTRGLIPILYTTEYVRVGDGLLVVTLDKSEKALIKIEEIVTSFSMISFERKVSNFDSKGWDYKNLVNYMHDVSKKVKMINEYYCFTYSISKYY